MRRRDQNILARELRQQLIPRRRSRSLVDVENRGDLGVLQFDSLCMDDVAPKQNFLSLGRKFIAGMSRGVTMQRDDLHAVDDWLGAAERVPFTGRGVRRCDSLGTLEERISFLPVWTRKPISTTSNMCVSSCSALPTPSIVAFVPFSQCGSNTPVPSYRAVTSRSPTFSR